jgi:hypothetical protein
MLQRDASVANGSGDSCYLNMRQIAKRDNKGGATASETPLDMIKRMTPGEGNKSANNSSYVPNKAARTNIDGKPRAIKSAQFPSTMRKGTWKTEALSLQDQ